MQENGGFSTALCIRGFWKRKGGRAEGREHGLRYFSKPQMSPPPNEATLKEIKIATRHFQN